MSQNQGNVTRSTVTFPDGRQSVLVETLPGVAASEIIKALDLKKPGAVILIPGGGDVTDPELQARLFQLFSRGLALAVARNGAVIIDDAIDSGVIAILGKAMADRASESSLLGVTNDGQVVRPDAPDSNGSSERKTLEPNHRYFVLLKNSNSGAQVGKMHEIAEELSQGVPILTLLVNGNSAARVEVLRGVRQDQPILVINGSGGFADEIYSASQARQDYINKQNGWDPTSTDEPKPTLPFIADSVMAEVIAEGDLHFFSITDTPENLEQYINLRLKAGSILNQAYAQQRLYDTNAGRYQKTFRRQQNWILGLGVFLTALAAFQSFYKPGNILSSILHILLISIPVLLAVLIAGSNRFNAGDKYISIRTAAEAIGREIFRYRTRTGIYSDIQVAKNKTSREVTLANMLESIARQWVEGILDFGSLHPVPAAPPRSKPQRGIADNGFGYLSPNRYVTSRLVDQLNYYSRKVLKLERKLFRLQWLILGLGGIATVLAALGVEWLITVTTVGSTALATYLEYNQVASTLKKFNYAILTLTDIQNWWIALEDAQADPVNIDKLVNDTEATLQSEHAGWVQQMQAALTELRTQQAKQGAASSVTEPINTALSVQPSANAAQDGNSVGASPAIVPTAGLVTENPEGRRNAPPGSSV